MHVIVRIHHRVGIIRVAESESVSGFMQSNAIDIHVGADLPVLDIIEMHIACDRFWIGGHRVKSMSQHV